MVIESTTLSALASHRDASRTLKVEDIELWIVLVTISPSPIGRFSFTGPRFPSSRPFPTLQERSRSTSAQIQRI